MASFFLSDAAALRASLRLNFALLLCNIANASLIGISVGGFSLRGNDAEVTNGCEFMGNLQVMELTSEIFLDLHALKTMGCKTITRSVVLYYDSCHSFFLGIE